MSNSLKSIVNAMQLHHFTFSLLYTSMLHLENKVSFSSQTSVLYDFGSLLDQSKNACD